jgi:hypothetical protein
MNSQYIMLAFGNSIQPTSVTPPRCEWVYRVKPGKNVQQSIVHGPKIRRSWVRIPARTARFGDWENLFTPRSSTHPGVMGTGWNWGRTFGRLITSCPGGVEILSAAPCHWNGGKYPHEPYEWFCWRLSFFSFNQDTSQLRTAVVSPKGVLNGEVPLCFNRVSVAKITFTDLS